MTKVGDTVFSTKSWFGMTNWHPVTVDEVFPSGAIRGTNEYGALVMLDKDNYEEGKQLYSLTVDDDGTVYPVERRWIPAHTLLPHSYHADEYAVVFGWTEQECLDKVTA